MVGAMGVGFEFSSGCKLELGRVHWKYKVFQCYTDDSLSTHRHQVCLSIALDLF